MSNLSLKIRKNKWMVISFSIIILICFLGFAFYHNLYYIFIGIHFDPSADLKEIGISTMQKILIGSTRDWTLLVISGFMTFPITLPLAVSITGLSFVDEMERYIFSKFSRIKNYYRYIFKEAFVTSLKGTVIALAGIILFLIFASFLAKEHHSYFSASVEQLIPGIYINNPFLALLIMTLSYYGPAIFVVILLVCSISLYIKKSIFVIATFMVYHLIMLNLNNVPILKYLSLMHPMNGYNSDQNLLTIFLPILTNFIIAIILIIIYKFIRRKPMD